MSYPEVVLRPHSERLLLKGHPWVYSGAVASVSKDVEPGQIVDVFDSRTRFVARGYYNPHSTISVRVLTRDSGCAIDRRFLVRTLERALRLRRDHRELRGATDACRLVHGENDGLPGLIVDDYAGFLVVQFHTFGVEVLRPDIIEALDEVARPKGIYERSDVGTRRADGLRTRPTGHLTGAEPPPLIEIQEYGVRLLVDVRKGQKTGFFLDQRSNRALLQAYAAGGDVLDCFAYSGGFAAHALMGGASRVTSVDIARDAAGLAAANASANSSGEQRHHVLVADLFPLLDEFANSGPRFDAVVLDPPRPGPPQPRCQTRHWRLHQTQPQRHEAGQRRWHADDGFLLHTDLLRRLLPDRPPRRRRRPCRRRIHTCNLHPPDHPLDPAFPEGRYLKAIFVQIFR